MPVMVVTRLIVIVVSLGCYGCVGKPADDHSDRRVLLRDGCLDPTSNHVRGTALAIRVRELYSTHPTSDDELWSDLIGYCLTSDAARAKAMARLRDSGFTLREFFPVGIANQLRFIGCGEGVLDTMEAVRFDQASLTWIRTGIIEPEWR